jgi:hypothetical protein
MSRLGKARIIRGFYRLSEYLFTQLLTRLTEGKKETQ